MVKKSPDKKKKSSASIEISPNPASLGQQTLTFTGTGFHKNSLVSISLNEEKKIEAKVDEKGCLVDANDPEAEPKVTVDIVDNDDQSVVVRSVKTKKVVAHTVLEVD